MPIRGAPRRVSAMGGAGVGAQMGSKGKTGAGGVYYADVVTGAAAKRSKRPASTRPLARPAWDSASSDLASMRRTPEESRRVAASRAKATRACTAGRRSAAAIAIAQGRAKGAAEDAAAGAAALSGDIDWAELALGAGARRPGGAGAAGSEGEGGAQEVPGARAARAAEGAGRGAATREGSWFDFESADVPLVDPTRDIKQEEETEEPLQYEGPGSPCFGGGGTPDTAQAAAEDAMGVAALARDVARRVHARDALVVAHQLREEVGAMRAQLAAVRDENEQLRRAFGEYRDHSSAMVAALQKHLTAMLAAQHSHGAERPPLPSALTPAAERLRDEVDRRFALLAESSSDDGDGIASDSDGDFELEEGAAEQEPAATMHARIGVEDLAEASVLGVEADGLMAEESSLPHFSSAIRSWSVREPADARPRAPPPFLLGKSGRPTPVGIPLANSAEDGARAGTVSLLRELDMASLERSR